MQLDRFIGDLYDLNVGLVGTGADQHERPHKPVLLLAVLDAVARGEATPDRIAWSDALRERFRAYFQVVRARDDRCTPQYPFYHLARDGFWHPEVVRAGDRAPLARPPTRSDQVVARLDPEVATLFQRADTRRRLREALISRYFPGHRDAILDLVRDEAAVAADDPPEDYQPDSRGRSRAFRSLVLQHYDYQCAACGLRLWLRELDLAGVDAAHLVPWKEGHNDHPSNGMALCKNHHWAMDRHLIAPTRQRVWRSSPVLDPRRSRGEEDLVSLDGARVIEPRKEAYRPWEAGLAWRESRLRGTEARAG